MKKIVDAKEMSVKSKILNKYSIPKDVVVALDDEISVRFKVPSDFIGVKKLSEDAVKMASTFPDEEKETMFYVYLLSFVMPDFSDSDLEEIARDCGPFFELLVLHFDRIFSNPLRYVTQESLTEAEKKSEETPITVDA